MRRSSLVWGVVLLLLGLLLFADAAGIRLPGGARPMEFFWPLVLILAGAWVIFGVLMRPQPQSEQAFVELQGAGEAVVEINHGAGELHIAGGAGMGQLASGTFVGGLEQSAQRAGNRLNVRLSPPSRSFPFFGEFDRYNWDMRLNPEIPMTLRLKTGADNADVDLSALRVTGLKLETGASKTDITLPRSGRLAGDFSLGAASLTIIVPDGVAARVRVSQGVSNVSVNQSRFPRAGDVYQSMDFESAANAVDIRVDAGAADVKVQ